jgi:hypothetical protein
MMVLSICATPITCPKYQKRATTTTKQGMPVGMNRVKEDLFVLIFYVIRFMYFSMVKKLRILF